MAFFGGQAADGMRAQRLAKEREQVSAGLWLVESDHMI